MAEVKETWWDRLSPEERKRRSKVRSEQRQQDWVDPKRRKKLSRKMKKIWKENQDDVRQKQKEGLERSKRRTRILMGLEPESDQVD